MNKANTKSERNRSLLALPKIGKPYAEDANDEEQIKAKVRSISIMNLQKAKLKYPSFT